MLLFRRGLYPIALNFRCAVFGLGCCIIPPDDGGLPNCWFTTVAGVKPPWPCEGNERGGWEGYGIGGGTCPGFDEFRLAIFCYHISSLRFEATGGYYSPKILAAVV